MLVSFLSPYLCPRHPLCLDLSSLRHVQSCSLISLTPLFRGMSSTQRCPKVLSKIAVPRVLLSFFIALATTWRSSMYLFYCYCSASVSSTGGSLDFSLFHSLLSTPPCLEQSLDPGCYSSSLCWVNEGNMWGILTEVQGKLPGRGDV